MLRFEYGGKAILDARAAPLQSGEVIQTLHESLRIDVGLLLGIVVAFIRDAMDRRLRDPREIDSSFQLPLLGYVGKRSMGRVAGARNGTGAKHSQVQLIERTDRRLKEATRLRRRKIQTVSRKRR